MGSYLLDLGNSNDGPIGMVLRVNACTKAEAVEVARKALRLVAGDCGHIALCVPTEIRDEVEYINLYLNPNVITEKDVSDDDTEETIAVPGPIDWSALARAEALAFEPCPGLSRSRWACRIAGCHSGRCRRWRWRSRGNCLSR